MRTTIDLQEKDHALFVSLAQARGTTLSKIILELAYLGLQRPTGLREAAAGYSVSDKTGLPQFASSRVITAEDVRSLEEE